MKQGIQRGLQRVTSLLKKKGNTIVSAAETSARKTKMRVTRSETQRRKIADNINDAVSNRKETGRVEDNIQDQLQRQQQFIQRTQTGVTAVTKTFNSIFKKALEKPVAVLQRLILGLIVSNVGKIIESLKNVINKFRLIKLEIGAYFNIVTDFVGVTWSVLSAITQNLLEFDFTDESGRISNAITEYQIEFDKDIDRIGDIRESWSLGGRELEDKLRELEGFNFGDPSSNVQPTETATGLSAPGTSSGPATPEEYRIAAAVASEAGRGLSATDVLQVAANRVGSSAYPNTYDAVFTQPGQFAGVEDRGSSEFLAIQNGQDAAAWLGGGATPSTIDGYVSDLRNQSNRTSSADFVGGATEFRAAPSYYQDRPGERPAGTGSDGRIPDSNWRGGSGDNQILTGPQDPSTGTGAAPVGAFTAPPPSQAPQPGNYEGTKLTGVLTSDQFNKSPSQTSSPIARTSEYGMRNGSMHNGVDFGTGGQRGWFCALLLDGTITYAATAGNGGNTVIIKSGSKEYVFMHLANYSPGIKQGAKYSSGQPIGEVGNTGRSRGIHLHYEVRIGNVPQSNVGNYVNLVIFGKMAQRNASKMQMTPAQRTATLNPSQGLNFNYEEGKSDSKVILMTQPVIAQQVIPVPVGGDSGGSGMVAVPVGKSTTDKFNDALMVSLN